MNLTFFKRVLRSVFLSLGLDLNRYHPETDKWLAQKKLLEDVEAPVILDVGANVGQTLEAYKSLFPEAEVHCFEPYPDSYRTLQELASQFSRTQTHKLAVAERAGESTFYINPVFHPTNSLLPRPASGRQYYPTGAELEKTISVKTDTLDAIVRRLNLSRVNVLKMDIQGAELSALQGAESLLGEGAIDLIMLEIMFVPHYEGGALFHELHEFLRLKSYSLFGIYDAHFDDMNWQMRFADAIFISQDLRVRLK
jgi:FkbM family methyltransferase